MPAPPHDGTGHTWHHAGSMPVELTGYGLAEFAGGRPRVRYAGVLSGEEIVAVLSRIKSRWPEHARVRRGRIGRRFAERPERRRSCSGGVSARFSRY